MVSTVRSRPNHYETLGLAPTASNEEIARAFAREIGMFRPRALGGVAEVSIAYETLRDPVRRRAYDVSLGLRSAPEPSPAPTPWPAGSQFIGVTARRPVARPVHDRLLAPAPLAMPQPRPEADARPAPEPQASGDLLLDHAAELSLDDAVDHKVQWLRSAIAAGGVVVAVVLLGVLAGWQVRNDEDVQQPEVSVTAKLPPPKPLTAAASMAPAPASEIVEAEPRRAARVAAAPVPIRPGAGPARPAVLDQQVAEAIPPEESQPAESQPAESMTEQAAEQAPAAETAAALPLPSKVIARTIERIGFACGEVASTSAVEGGSGVYKVTCTSGATYQATPVRGRYHFRRLGSH
jgi:hypothetical protein